MSLLSYIKDKIVFITVQLVMMISIIFLLFIFNTNLLLIIDIAFLLFIFNLFLLLYDFFRKKNFYKKIDKYLNNLDKKYLINELIDSPSFLEARLLYDYLYEINKNYLEELNNYRINQKDFKEYIEMWCHEIKTPIATSLMIIENNKNSITTNINEEINKIGEYVEQVLYFARSENVEKDYIIKEVNLKEIVNYVIKKNKKQLIESKVKLEIEDLNVFVNSDSKWLIFIINQIINNSIKYSSKDPVLKISVSKAKNHTTLNIYDNGIGIKDTEIEHVFDNGFTGTNGRKYHSSTGIGLYLCKKLCIKLGHSIKIKSEENKYTCVCISFPISSMIKDNLE